MENIKNGMPAKKGLDVMIAIGTKKGLGMKDNAMDSSSNQNDAENVAEDNAENEMNRCDNCDKEMVCSGCNKPESECSC